MMRALLLLVLTGCAGYTIQPGHRGLLFNTRAGLQREVLEPGYHKTGMNERVRDYDITYSTRREDIHAVSQEGVPITVRIAVIFRPIIAELYELDSEVGPNYYDELIGPEFRSGTRHALGQHAASDLHRSDDKVEAEVESSLRQRLRGKHLEVHSITIEGVQYPPEFLTTRATAAECKSSSPN